MKQVIILITTYNRPEKLQTLLHNLQREIILNPGINCQLIIANDNSTSDYSIVNDYVMNNFTQPVLAFSDEHFGKAKYWQFINSLYRAIKDTLAHYDYFIQLPDDVTLAENFLQKAILYFDNIPNRKKVCLNLLTDYPRVLKPMWTTKIPNQFQHNGIEYYQTGWTDLCLISDKSYLQSIDYSIHEVPEKWANNPDLSSGVGMQISKRLFAKRKSMFHIKTSLVFHGDHKSVMHPEHRKQNKLIATERTDKVIASMATMPSRIKALSQAVLSLINQVDELRIYLNEFESIPNFLLHPKITVFRSQEHLGDLGDVGKFYKAEDIEGYHLTADDDIIYPPDYVNYMVSQVELEGRKAVISAHGRTFSAFPVQSYYRAEGLRISCLKTLDKNINVHVIGTGVMAYHTDTLKIPHRIFKFTNMSDIWVSLYCTNLGIPKIICAHKKGWLTLSTKYNSSDSIFSNQFNSDHIQTNVVNSNAWEKLND